MKVPRKYKGRLCTEGECSERHSWQKDFWWLPIAFLMKPESLARPYSPAPSCLTSLAKGIFQGSLPHWLYSNHTHVLLGPLRCQSAPASGPLPLLFPLTEKLFLPGQLVFTHSSVLVMSSGKFLVTLEVRDRGYRFLLHIMLFLSWHLLQPSSSNCVF